jgi:DNA-binding HxlR family transcriptional regulator
MEQDIARDLATLANAGFITSKGVDEETGDELYYTTPKQAQRLFPFLRRPASWDESPILRECKEALQMMRDEAIRNDVLED